MPRNNTKSHKGLQDKFIAEYVANGGVKLRATTKLGIDYKNACRWFKDPEFVERLTEAEDHWYESLKAALLNRALTKSDQAAFFLLKSKFPEVYDDNVRKAKWLDERGMTDPDSTVDINVNLIQGPLPEDQLVLEQSKN